MASEDSSKVGLMSVARARQVLPKPVYQTAKSLYQGKDGSRIRKSNGMFVIAGDRMLVGKGDHFSLIDLVGGSKVSDELKWFRRGCTNLRAAPYIVTTRYQGNAAYVDLATREITPLWNIRSGCYNNLIPANGVLNVRAYEDQIGKIKNSAHQCPQ